MLFDYHLFEPIMRGEITLTYRNWSRPQAREGARHRLNREGEIEIISVTQVSARDITPADSMRAGFDGIESLMDALTSHHPLPPSGQVYRIEFSFVRRSDPRVQLAARASLTAAQAAVIAARLNRMDARSVHGPWTRETLRLIADNPRVLSTTLAAKVRRDRLALKTDVRKLKALGLTISHEVGYEISPRGRAFLARDRRT